MTANIGRGVFATRNLKKGELIIAERPIAYSKEKEIKDTIEFEISELKYNEHG